MTPFPPVSPHPVQVAPGCQLIAPIGPDWSSWSVEGDAFGARPVNEATVIAEQGGGDGPLFTSAVAPRGSVGRVRIPAFVVQEQFLNFRICGGDFEFATCLNLLLDGIIVRSETGRQCSQLWWATFDLSHLQGQRIELEIVDQADGEWGYVTVSDLHQSPTARGATWAVPLYQEPSRPLVHFTARQWTMDRLDPRERQEGWLNDINGLVVKDGEYHLFAQRWNKCWIHAVSPDLVHWTELEPAFFEEELGSGVQSGSCVVDWDNTSGLAVEPDTAPLVAFWSRNDELSQCISYSQDDGRTWTHYADNPILRRGERDPMVFRDHDRNQWVMVLYGYQQYHFLTSDNLLEWHDCETPVGDCYECPDLFELPVQDTDTTQWVLVRGDGSYTLGHFDGRRFTQDRQLLHVDGGPNFYATQSWDVPVPDGRRRVQVAWMRTSQFPHMPFSQQVSIPCDLSLRDTPVGVRLHRYPVPELDRLVRSRSHWTNHFLQPGSPWEIGANWPAFRLRCSVDLPEGAELAVELCGTTLRASRDRISVLDTIQPTLTPLTHLDILLDVASVEVFANGGEASLTACFQASQPSLTLFTEADSVTIVDMELQHLDSMWASSTTAEAPSTVKR